MIVVNFLGSIFLILDMYQARNRAYLKRDRIHFSRHDSSSVSSASDFGSLDRYSDSSNISSIADDTIEESDLNENKNVSGLTSSSKRLGKKAYGILKKMIETKKFKKREEENRNTAFANSINFYFEMISQFLPNNLVDKYIDLLNQKYYIDAFFLLNNLYERNDFGQKFFEDAFYLHIKSDVKLDFHIEKLNTVYAGASRIKVSKVKHMFPRFVGSISRSLHRNSTRDCKVIIITSDLSNFSFKTSYTCSKLGALTAEFYVPHFVLSPRLLAKTSAKCDYIVFKYFLRALSILAKCSWEKETKISKIDHLFRKAMLSESAVSIFHSKLLISKMFYDIVFTKPNEKTFELYHSILKYGYSKSKRDSKSPFLAAIITFFDCL